MCFVTANRSSFSLLSTGENTFQGALKCLDPQANLTTSYQVASGAGGTEWISRPYGANPALMVQVNYKQGPPAVLSNKTRQEGNCPELEHRGTQQAGKTLNIGRNDFPTLSFSTQTQGEASRQGDRKSAGTKWGTLQNCRRKVFQQTTAGCPAQRPPQI